MQHPQQPAGQDSLQQTLQAAAELSDDGRWAEAFQLLFEQEERTPDDPVLLCMLGVAAGEVEVPGMAYEFFRRCLAQDPQDPSVLVAAGTGLATYDDPEAERALRLAAIAAPTLLVARLAYGAYLAREGMTDLALEELRAARELDDDDPRVHRALGVALLLRGDEQDGLAALEDAVARAPDDAQLRLLLGLALVQHGRLETGAEELHRASAELAQDGEMQLLTALACASQEWMDEAWNALARAEQAPLAPPQTLLREGEDALEAGAPAAGRLLREHLAPAMLRERLHELSV